jgi:AcrR family transcriptional regulator
LARAYRMGARAEAAEKTGQRILAAALERFTAAHFDEVTLDSIAEGAGVTVQTVVRRFGSKEDLVRAVAQAQLHEVADQRGRAPVGDISGAISNLVDHYEQYGDIAMHLLRQETRVEALAKVAADGKRFHDQWVWQVFSPWLDKLEGMKRKRLYAQLVTVCDVYTWHLLRQRRGLSRRQTELALIELLEGVLS